MEKKETFSEEISDIQKEIVSYVQNKIDLSKLQLAEDFSRLLSGIAVKVILFYIGFFVLMLSSIAGAFAIGSTTGSNELGFLIVAGFYVILGFVFYLLRSVLIHTPIIRAIVQLFFPNFTKYDK